MGNADDENPQPKLNLKQRRFCEEYLVDLNATQAAERAGYSKATARAQGHRLLTYADVKAQINELLIERGERVRIDQDYVLHNLTVVIERSLQRAPVMVREGRELVHEVDADGNHVWEFDAAGANTALGLLGKHLRLFTEKHEHSGPNGKPIEVKNTSDLTDEQLEARIAEKLAKLQPKEPVE